MFIKQLYTNSLSEAAYFIESEGEAAVIDPLRDIQPYIDLAAERNATIKYIFETHLHADFISGHLDLSKATGAPIVFGPGVNTRYPVTVANDGDIFSVGKLSIKVLHTPGHTVESSCFLLQDENGGDHALFTGDTLLIGDASRPDVSGGQLSSEELAASLYDTIVNKISPLNDEVIIYPGRVHSNDRDKNNNKETSATIGQQRQSNFGIGKQAKEEFIKTVTADVDEPPIYFNINAQINKNGYESLEVILQNGLQPLSIEAFKAKAGGETIILDSRAATVFTLGFVPASINIGLEGKFGEWAGSLLSFDKPIVLVTEKGKERETIVKLARVGFSKIEGYLDGGFEAWQQAGEKIDIIIDVEVDELAMDIPFDEHLVVLDVRKEVEYADGHVKDAENFPLNLMNDVVSLSRIEDKDNLYIHCGSGYRSVIAASLLKRQGIHNLRNVLGGWEKIKEEPRIKTEKEAAALN